MDIDTHAVLEAAGTKWNFFLIKPGFSRWSLHWCWTLIICAQKVQELGYHPEIILAGRRLNDSMGEVTLTGGETNDKKKESC
jgi:UDP-N-acetyl-D-galactosamine dehydrogenase